MLVGSAASALAGYVYWTFLSRRFGASVVGEVAALGAVAAVVSLLNAHSLGASILSRLPSLSPGSQRALLRAAVLLGGVLAALGAAVGWVLLLLGSDGSFLRDPGLFVVFVVGVAAQSIGSTLDMASLALRSSGLAAVRNGASSLLRLPILAAFAAFLGAFGGLAAALLTSTIVSLLSVLWLVRSLARVLPETGHPVALSDVVGELRRGAGAQTLVALGTGAPAQLLPALVVAFAGATAGGHFSIAWLVGSTCFMIPPMVCSSLLTEAARDLDALGRRVRHASALIALLLTPPVVAYLLAGERILTLFGDGFATGGSRPLRAPEHGDARLGECAACPRASAPGGSGESARRRRDDGRGSPADPGAGRFGCGCRLAHRSGRRRSRRGSLLAADPVPDARPDVLYDPAGAHPVKNSVKNREFAGAVWPSGSLPTQWDL
jgi:O-antigen/teichoic acid export membrane protein